MLTFRDREGVLITQDAWWARFRDPKYCTVEQTDVRKKTVTVETSWLGEASTVEDVPGYFISLIRRKHGKGSIVTDTCFTDSLERAREVHGKLVELARRSS